MPYIDINQPWIYMCSLSWTPLPLPHHPIPLGHPSAPAPSTCLMHPTWTGELFTTALPEKVFHYLYCCCSAAKSCPNLCSHMDCSTPSFLVLQYLPEFAQTHVHWVGDAIQPSYPLWPLLLLPSIFPSIRAFPNESALCIRWPKYWSFSISLSDAYSGLISFRINLFDLLTVQGTLKSLLQHHSLKASILWCSAFFMVHLSQPYMTAGKTIALTK